MKAILMKALVNFLMVQTILLATAWSMSFSLPIDYFFLKMFLFMYITSAAMTLIPAIVISVWFATFQKN